MYHCIFMVAANQIKEVIAIGSDTLCIHRKRYYSMISFWILHYQRRIGISGHHDDFVLSTNNSLTLDSRF